MSLTEQHIETARKSINEIFDNLLEAVRANTAFIDELNATNAQYDVAFIATPPETPCEIPVLEDLPEPQPEPVDEKPANKEVLIEKFDLQEISTIQDADWLRYVRTIMIAGWTVERLQSSSSCKNVVFSKAETELLKNLEGLRFSMLEKDMDLNLALSQNWVGVLETIVIREFAEKNNLK